MKKLSLAAALLAAFLPLSSYAAEDEESMVPPPSGEELSTLKKDNFTTLLKEINDVANVSALSAEQKEAVAKSLSALAQGEVHPSEAKIKTLAGVVSRATVNGKLSEAQLKKLSNAFLTVLDSDTGTPAAAKAAVKTIQSTYQAAGIKTDAGTINTQLLAILDELAKKQAATAG